MLLFRAAEEISNMNHVNVATPEIFILKCKWQVYKIAKDPTAVHMYCSCSHMYTVSAWLCLCVYAHEHRNQYIRFLLSRYHIFSKIESYQK